MQVRNIRAEDIYEVLKIEYECFKFPYPPNMINFLYANYIETFLVAETDTILGYVIGITYNDEGHIISLAVREEYRGLGVGRALMEEVMGIFKDKQYVSSVRLEVRKSNDRAITFYKRLGFDIVELLDEYYDDKEDAYVMTKRVR
ncbi:MAG: ribosomal protein S18-alanine N-acetyltransferase [Candidatus Methanofastidiosa archaeon]|nr:ribosomal protein S18-alanine N-acetyltransferase [Candidatus Methanofastidiosa archaeon]